MKKAIIIHGWSDKEEYMSQQYPSPSNSHWIPWLQKQLTMRGYDAQTPEMPDGYEPSYEKWKTTFERLDPDKDTILVGHSCGAGFLVRWLSETGIQVGPVILVAPWIDPKHEERAHISDFFDFDIDPDISDRTDGITIFISTDDGSPMLESVQLLEQKLKGFRTKHYEDMGHFTLADMGTNEFPELLNECLL